MDFAEEHHEQLPAAWWFQGNRWRFCLYSASSTVIHITTYLSPPRSRSTDQMPSSIPSNAQKAEKAIVHVQPLYRPNWGGILPALYRFRHPDSLFILNPVYYHNNNNENSSLLFNHWQDICSLHGQNVQQQQWQEKFARARSTNIDKTNAIAAERATFAWKISSVHEWRRENLSHVQPAI